MPWPEMPLEAMQALASAATAAVLGESAQPFLSPAEAALAPAARGAGYRLLPGWPRPLRPAEAAAAEGRAFARALGASLPAVVRSQLRPL